MLDVIRGLEKYLSENIDCAVVTVIDTKGSTPARIGFKMLADSKGLVTGTVGGGSLEHFALSKCRELINSKEKYFTGVFSLNDNLNKNPKNKSAVNNKNIKINTLCGGEATLFFEVYQRSKTMHIFGAGHVSGYLIKYATELKYFVNVYDNREELLNEIPPSVLIKKHKTDLSKLDESIFKINDDDFIVVVTHNHINDLNVLEFLYKNFDNLKYIGMIGSIKKVTEGIEFLKHKIKSKINLKNLYAPIGIDIGGESPAEIALSIMAEIQAVNSGKKVSHLRIKNL